MSRAKFNQNGQQEVYHSTSGRANPETMCARWSSERELHTPNKKNLKTGSEAIIELPTTIQRPLKKWPVASRAKLGHAGPKLPRTMLCIDDGNLCACGHSS